MASDTPSALIAGAKHLRRTEADVLNRADIPTAVMQAAMGRSELFTRARPVSDEELSGLELAPGAVFIALAVDLHARSVAEERKMTLVATSYDPNPEDAGPGEYPVYLLFRAP